MTLPASGTITMTNVKNELAVAFPLNLAASNVRTLFVKPTGAIKLTDGYGKSNQVRWYATSYTGTATNPAYAYDKEIADSTAFSYTSYVTAAVVSSPVGSNGYSEFILYFGPVTSKVMKLSITLNCSNSPVTVPGYYVDCGTGPYFAQRTYQPSPAARCTIEISTDGGGSWTPQIDVSVSYAKYYTNLGGTFYTGSNIALRFRAYGQGIGVDFYSDPGSGCDAYEGTTGSSASIQIWAAILE